MKTKQYWLKSTQSILLSTLTMMWICTTFPVFADTDNPTVEENSSAGDTPTVVPSLLNPADARARLQIAYVFNVGQQITNALDAYQARYNQVASEASFKWFVDTLLKIETDPLVQSISYVPEQSLTIIMHRNIFVEPLLHGIKFAYVYTDAKIWEFDQEHSTVAGTEDPSPRPLDYWSSLITNDCQADQSSQSLLENSDEQWCSKWLDAINSLPAE